VGVTKKMVGERCFAELAAPVGAVMRWLVEGLTVSLGAAK